MACSDSCQTINASSSPLLLSYPFMLMHNICPDPARYKDYNFLAQITVWPAKSLPHPSLSAQAFWLLGTGNHTSHPAATHQWSDLSMQKRYPCTPRNVNCFKGCRKKDNLVIIHAASLISQMQTWLCVPFETGTVSSVTAVHVAILHTVHVLHCKIYL